MKKAFITGISGQDGSYLAEHLLSLGYDVHGIVRRHSMAEEQNTRIQHIQSNDKITTYYGDLLDQGGIEQLLDQIQPNEIYNIAAQSHVRISFDIPQFTIQTNALGVSNMVRNYRRAYNLHACNGILFNHESPRRGSNFVTNKVCKAAARIKLGLQDKLELGNMDSYRDWGHSKDYVRAMHLIMQYNKPDDFIVSTMETHSVREMCEVVFSYLDLNYKDYVTQNPKYLRPEELPYLRGDSTKIRKTLGWEPTYTFREMMEEMVNYWFKKFKSATYD
jgi:GDPmannose 4,6-dehydratase